MTLLEIVQEILSAMDSDEVNSIGDTTESIQVAREVRNTYFDLLGPLSIPDLEGLTHLEPFSDTTRPTYLKIPDKVSSVTYVQYNLGTPEDPVWSEVEYLNPVEFVRLLDRQKGSVVSVDPGGVSLRFRNDKAPKYYTSFDDRIICFDSFDKELDDTLQSSKTRAHVVFTPEFRLEDSFVPRIPASLISTFIAEAKSACFNNLKQLGNALEQSRARRGIVRAQNDRKRAEKERQTYPNYGRPRPI